MRNVLVLTMLTYFLLIYSWLSVTAMTDKEAASSTSLVLADNQILNDMTTASLLAEPNLASSSDVQASENGIKIADQDVLAPWDSKSAIAIDVSKLDLLVNKGIGYSNSLYPIGEGENKTTIVDVSVSIKNFGPVSETDVSFNSELYLTFSWTDPRLKFSRANALADGSSGNYFQLTSISDQNKVWTPSVYFSNTRTAVRSNILKENAVMFIRPNGNVIQRTRYSNQMFIVLNKSTIEKMEVSFFAGAD